MCILNDVIEGDEFPVLIHKVSKLQKQVREMRKFMRGLVQLQVEQYEPATIMIQAWWRGCLVSMIKDAFCAVEEGYECSYTKCYCIIALGSSRTEEAKSVLVASESILQHQEIQVLDQD